MRKYVFILLFLVSHSLVAQEAQFDFTKFNKKQGGVIYSGTAKDKKGILELTENKVKQRGAIWYTQRKMPVADTFETSFCFTIDKIKGKGGEGIAWVIHNNEIPNKNGSKTKGMGYANIPNSIAIEFDTQDQEKMGGQHISIQTKGVQKNSYRKEASIASANIESFHIDDGEEHQAHILYRNPKMVISIDGHRALETTMDITELINLDRGAAWTGLTSTTGKKNASRNRISCFSMKGKDKEPPYSRASTKKKLKRAKRVIVHSKNLTVQLWDINQEDGDIVSLNLNGKWLVQKYPLTNTKRTFHFELDGQVNYLVLHAHNLGEIPPNTAGISVSDGISGIQEFTLRSNLYLSDALLIEYHKKVENEVNVTRKSGSGRTDRKEEINN